MAQTKSKTESAFDSVIPMDVPVAMRDMAEQGVAQAKDAYAKMKVVADQTTELVEGTYSSTFKGLSTLGQKSIETARANSNAAFDHAMAMFGVKTISDAIELQTAFMRKQSESMTAQAKEMGELVQKLAGDVTAPVKTTMEKAMKLSA